MKKDLNFTKSADGTWEAEATGIVGAWQLYIEFPGSGSTMKILTRAGDDEQWDEVHTRYMSPAVDTIPFVSIITENVKITTDTQPVKANIRMED